MNPLIPALVNLIARLIPQGLDLGELVVALGKSDEIPESDRDAMKARIDQAKQRDWTS